MCKFEIIFILCSVQTTTTDLALYNDFNTCDIGSVYIHKDADVLNNESNPTTALISLLDEEEIAKPTAGDWGYVPTREELEDFPFLGDYFNRYDKKGRCPQLKGLNISENDKRIDYDILEEGKQEGENLDDTLGLDTQSAYFKHNKICPNVSLYDRKGLLRGVFDTVLNFFSWDHYIDKYPEDRIDKLFKNYLRYKVTEKKNEDFDRYLKNTFKKCFSEYTCAYTNGFSKGFSVGFGEGKSQGVKFVEKLLSKAVHNYFRIMPKIYFYSHQFSKKLGFHVGRSISFRRSVMCINEKDVLPNWKNNDKYVLSAKLGYSTGRAFGYNDGVRMRMNELASGELGVGSYCNAFISESFEEGFDIGSLEGRGEGYDALMNILNPSIFNYNLWNVITADHAKSVINIDKIPENEYLKLRYPAHFKRALFGSPK